MITQAACAIFKRVLISLIYYAVTVGVFEDASYFVMC